MGKSSVGPGIKAGGPNYVAPLMNFSDAPDVHSVFTSEDAERLDRGPKPLPAVLTPPHAVVSHGPELLQEFYRKIVESADSASAQTETELRRVLAAVASYEHWAREEFSAAHDHFRLLGEDNFRRYLPVEPLRIRIHSADSLSEVFCRAAAARAAGCRAIVSAPTTLTGATANFVDLLDSLTHSWAGAIEFIDEDDEALAEAIRTGQVARVRYAAPDRVPDVVRLAAAESLQYIADAPVSRHGRIELLWYVREQSISHIYHRYGNLGLRANERRHEPA
jgi:RHH-type proline utilization regulon transcriptional repressor/proline dehydrogenase/delta 1-pyrroline-5-carboxylate dehydrogenase